MFSADISSKVNDFLQGFNPMEMVVNIECGYEDEQAAVIFNKKDGTKRYKLIDFKPFVWAKKSACVRMFGGNRREIIKALNKYGIRVTPLTVDKSENSKDERVSNGYNYMFYATKRMSWVRFQQFFFEAGTPLSQKKKKDGKAITNSEKEFLSVSVVEQFMIESGIRLFKGYEGYDETKRLVWDIETTGLDPKKDMITHIGVRTNKGFETVIEVDGDTKEEREIAEHIAIETFIRIIRDEKPDEIAGHNSENFDWNFIIVRWDDFGAETFQEMTLRYFTHEIYKEKRESVLKLGGEVEYFHQTKMWGTTVLDSMHAVRRAQATDSDIKKANLKYVTQYLGLKKENRVYIKGNKISTIWDDKINKYAFNDKNGEWYQIGKSKPLEEGFTETDGKYIVKRYLLDDLWETDKVELTLNEANFLISKMIPTTFQRACTMGTASIWKLIMLAWCYENGMAVPSFGVSKSFTGGLSRLLKVGYVDRIVKLDFNSLYPSIMLTWWIHNVLDGNDSMLNMLNYVLTYREHYKGLKAEAGNKIEELKKRLKEENLTNEEIYQINGEIHKQKIIKNANDKKQSPLKVLGNSVFGSFGAPSLFPFGNTQAAEMVTCIGRQCLRLMISHFKSIGYEPIVGDSFVGDTPLFIKYKDNNLIDIKAISELINENEIQTDVLNRQYDTSKKDYYVLCRSGWSEVNYIYRHETNKDIYQVSDDMSFVEVTEDHSLFDFNQNKIKPSEITSNTKLEYYDGEIKGNICKINKKIIKMSADLFNNGDIDRLDYHLLNMDIDSTRYLLNLIKVEPKTKVCKAQMLYLNSKLK